MPKYGCDHHNWKGEKSGYLAHHTWIARQLLKPNVCWECGTTKEKNRNYHWANISRKYLRDKKDWKRLCAKCHAKFDSHLYPRGDKINTVKLTEKQVVEIRKEYSTKKTPQKKLAKKYKVFWLTIFNVIHRKSWGHV